MRNSKTRSWLFTIALVAVMAVGSGAHAASSKAAKTKQSTGVHKKTVAKSTKRVHQTKQVAKHTEPSVEVPEVVTPPVAETKPQRATELVYSDTQIPTVRHDDRDIQCLARNIYFEAGNESRAGKVAVAQVTINRVRSGKFANTICGVVYERSQFSWVRQFSVKHIKLNSDRWSESLEVALAVLNGDELLADMTNALYFHNTSVRPGWGKPRIRQIGNHIFYRDKSTAVGQDI